jgi:hypothetical protein
MYNSPFKKKNIDKINSAGKSTVSNSMMSGLGDPPKFKGTIRTQVGDDFGGSYLFSSTLDQETGKYSTPTLVDPKGETSLYGNDPKLKSLIETAASKMEEESGFTIGQDYSEELKAFREADPDKKKKGTH